MPHVFDTGVAGAQRTRVRNAIITRLAPLLKSQGKYIAAIKALPKRFKGEGDEDGKAMIVHVMRGQEPSIGVALGRKQPEQAGLEPFTVLGELTFSVYVFGRNMRDGGALVDGRLAIDVVGAADNTADPGIEVILEHVEELLLGQELGVVGAQEVRYVDEDEVFTTEDCSCWEQIYAVTVERAINPSRANTLITSLEARHQLDGIPEGTIDNVGPGTPKTLDPIVTNIEALPPEDP